MTCAPRSTEDLEELVGEGLDRIHGHLFSTAETHVDGIDCLFGHSVARVLHDDNRRLGDMANQVHMDFDAYRNGIAEQLAHLQVVAEQRITQLTERLERATTCALCGEPLTTAIVHRARVGDVECRWHPKCCAGRCGNSDAHPPDYTVDAPLPARAADVALEMQTGAH